MGAVVVHLSSLVTYFQVSVVDQLLVLGPRDPPGRKVNCVIVSFSSFLMTFSFQAGQTWDSPVT